MKSEKLTEASRRWYDDACGTAHALELVGERWSLLVIRELMFGPRRFGELKAQLRGISANVLTQRLEGLEAVGLLTRRRLPSPASVQVYELTPWGYESEPIFQAMGRWATRSPLHDPRLPLSPASMMMSMRTLVVPERLAGWQARIGFRLPADRFVATVDDGALTIERGDGTRDVTFVADTSALLRTFYGKRPLAEAEADGSIVVDGDRAIAERYAGLFELPAKAAA